MILNGMIINIVKGDVAAFKADAYVVPQYCNKLSLTGVSARMVNTDCYAAVNTYEESVARYANPFGYAMPVKTEGSKVGLLIHSVVLGMPKKSKTDKKKIFNKVQLATYAAVVCAEKHGVKNLVMPALCTGDTGNMTYFDSASAMLSALSVCPTPKNVKTVTIAILHSDRAYNLFVAGSKNWLHDRPYDIKKDYMSMMDYQKVMGKE